jgi:hypothetical protein
MKAYAATQPIKPNGGLLRSASPSSVQPQSALTGDRGIPAPEDVVASPGSRLDSSTRTLMEGRFHYDFSRIRVHDNPQAAASARAVRASAYTIGNHIVFDAGRYAPSTPSGQALLAHELAHTVQQQIGRSGDSQAAEREAESAAVSFQAGTRVQVTSPAASYPLQRQESSHDYYDAPTLVRNIIAEQFRSRREFLALYDPDLSGLKADFVSTKYVKPGEKKPSETHPIPVIYVGKDFLDLSAADQKTKVGEQLDKIDKWSINYANQALDKTQLDKAQLESIDLENEYVTSRIRGLNNDQLTKLAGAAADPGVSAYANSLLTTSTPMQEGLTAASGGGLRAAIGPVTVIVLPDTIGEVPKGTDADTKWSGGGVSRPTVKGGKVTGFTVSPITVQTTYSPTAIKSDDQRYGRGTTATEKEVGAKSIRYHEGSHGLDVIRWVRANPFTGAIGDTLTAFQAKVKAFQQKFAELEKMKIATECAGTPMDAFCQKP